jgi:membrane protein involved in colicin uptake
LEERLEKSNWVLKEKAAAEKAAAEKAAADKVAAEKAAAEKVAAEKAAAEKAAAEKAAAEKAAADKAAAEKATAEKAAAAKAKKKPKKGMFVALSNRNAKVYINGREAGSIQASQTKIFRVPLGTFVVELKHNGQTLTKKGQMKYRMSHVFRFKGGKSVKKNVKKNIKKGTKKRLHKNVHKGKKRVTKGKKLHK